MNQRPTCTAAQPTKIQTTKSRPVTGPPVTPQSHLSCSLIQRNVQPQTTMTTSDAVKRRRLLFIEANPNPHRGPASNPVCTWVAASATVVLIRVRTEWHSQLVLSLGRAEQPRPASDPGRDRSACAHYLDDDVAAVRVGWRRRLSSLVPGRPYWVQEASAILYTVSVVFLTFAHVPGAGYYCQAGNPSSLAACSCAVSIVTNRSIFRTA